MDRSANRRRIHFQESVPVLRKDSEQKTLSSIVLGRFWDRTMDFRFVSPVDFDTDLRIRIAERISIVWTPDYSHSRLSLHPPHAPYSGERYKIPTLEWLWFSNPSTNSQICDWHLHNVTLCIVDTPSLFSPETSFYWYCSYPTSPHQRPIDKKLEAEVSSDSV